MKSHSLKVITVIAALNNWLCFSQPVEAADGDSNPPALRSTAKPRPEASFSDANQIDKNKNSFKDVSPEYIRLLTPDSQPVTLQENPISTEGGEARKMPALPQKSLELGERLTSLSPDFRSTERVFLPRPVLKSLISMRAPLNPLTLDSRYLQQMGLKDALNLAGEQNLGLSLTRNQALAQKYNYLSSLGRFLPDWNTGTGDFWAGGNANLGFLGLPNAQKLRGPLTVAYTGFNYYIWQGGSVVFGAKKSKHELNAARAHHASNYSDTLRDAANLYHKLILAEALLEIRISAVDRSEEQVRFNTERFNQGLATNLDVLQARTQLSSDRQALVDQQVLRRVAALNLLGFINADEYADVKAQAYELEAIHLVDPRTPIETLIQTAVDSRPELKQFAELRKAAKANAVVAAAPLHPTVAVNGYVVPLGNSPSSVEALFLLGITMNWHLGGLGTVDAYKIAEARTLARNAAIEVQKNLVLVKTEVRTAYLESARSEQNIDETRTQMASAQEELRFAKKRYEFGLGTNLDILTAQRDLTQAQINYATALTNYNIAQVELVRSLGICSVASLSTPKSYR